MGYRQLLNFFQVRGPYISLGIPGIFSSIAQSLKSRWASEIKNAGCRLSNLKNVVHQAMRKSEAVQAKESKHYLSKSTAAKARSLDSMCFSALLGQDNIWHVLSPEKVWLNAISHYTLSRPTESRSAYQGISLYSIKA